MSQNKFSTSQKKKSLPDRSPRSLEIALLANFKKNLKADLEQRQAPPWQPGQIPENWGQGLSDNLNKNAVADLAEQEKLKKLSPAELRKRQKDYHENFKKDLEAELERRQAKN